MKRLKVAVLGAGGLVAQRLQQRLANHPWFTLAAVAGSPRFQGRSLNTVPWVLEEARPSLPELTVLDATDGMTVERLAEEGVSVAFSALPSREAKDLEPMWARAGIAVFSNASAHRRRDGVPLVIPEINAEALRPEDGEPLRHACATNCTLLPLVFPLAALHHAFGLEAYTMRSEQALSGGGHAYMQGALDAGRVEAAIPGEAEKTGAEFRHVLDWDGGSTLVCNRVMRADGHHVFVEATLTAPVETGQVLDALTEWSNKRRFNHLPSAPHHPLMVVDSVDVTAHLHADGQDFPAQPDPSVDFSAGMAVVVGGVEVLNPNRVRFEAFSHNTLRGAAGGVVLLAELAHAMELISPMDPHP